MAEGRREVGGMGGGEGRGINFNGIFLPGASIPPGQSKVRASG
jgi:hypothetical protein